jgi:hypothetical protein
MKRVVSVSLGSKKGDKTAVATFLGEEFELTRRAAGGMEEAAALIRELDGQVDAIGLGGIDRYLYAGKKRYTIRDGERLARCAKVTPVVDGSGVKNTLERETIHWLQEEGVVDLARSKVLLVCAVDRFGMAEALDRLAGEVVYGDLLFGVGLPIRLRSHAQVRTLASLALPIITRLPFQWFYPTGEKQDRSTPRHEKHFCWADVIAGDTKYILRYMPAADSDALAGKTIVTQTLTPENLEAFRERGVARVITSTREYDGRTFATNVVEGVLVALAGKRPEEMLPEDYLEWLRRLEWEPTVHELPLKVRLSCPDRTAGGAPAGPRGP